MTIYQAVAKLEQDGGMGALCSIIESHGSTPRHEGSKMLVYEDGTFLGSVGGGEIENRVIQEAMGAMEDGKSRKLHYKMNDPSQGDPGLCGGQVDVYVEPIMPKAKIVILGGGHVGKALAHLAKWLGYRVAVSDDRAEYCTPEMNPDADEFYPVPMAELPQHLKINNQTYIVLTTRGVVVDVPGLPPLLDTKAAYIGIIGSKKRWVTTRKGLIQAGIPEEKLERIYSPIGLELNAETPEEIAVSIMAEIMMLRSGGTGKNMKMS